MDLASILDLETKTARISATLDYRPQLAGVWRQCAALSEAAASLALEDVPVSEAQILDLIMGNPADSEEPVSIWVAKDVYNTIMSPGHIIADPDRVFDRAYRAGRLSSLVDIREGGKASYPQLDNDPEWQEAKSLFAVGAPKILRAPGAISLKSIAVAALAAQIAPERHPISERIILMAAEGYLRHDLVLSDPAVSPLHDEIANPSRARWTFLPSRALSQGRFRAWSPLGEEGQVNLLSGLQRVMSHEVGRIGQIHAWIQNANETFMGQSSRSLRSALFELCQTNPILDAASVARSLDCSPRAARKLLGEAEAAGILQLATSRRSYRVWVIPALGAMIRERTSLRPTSSGSRLPFALDRQSTQIAPSPALPQERAGAVSTEEQLEAKVDDILEGLDLIMKKSEDILARYGSAGRLRRTQAITG